MLKERLAERDQRITELKAALAAAQAIAATMPGASSPAPQARRSLRSEAAGGVGTIASSEPEKSSDAMPVQSSQQGGTAEETSAATAPAEQSNADVGCTSHDGGGEGSQAAGIAAAGNETNPTAAVAATEGEYTAPGAQNAVSMTDADTFQPSNALVVPAEASKSMSLAADGGFPHQSLSAADKGTMTVDLQDDSNCSALVLVDKGNSSLSAAFQKKSCQAYWSLYSTQNSGDWS